VHVKFRKQLLLAFILGQTFAFSHQYIPFYFVAASSVFPYGQAKGYNSSKDITANIYNVLQKK